MITFEFDLHKGILRSEAEGVVTYDSIYTHLIDERRSAGLSWPEILDIRDTHFDVSSGEVRALVHLMRGLGESNLGPTAVVISSEIDFAITRMFGMLTDDLCAIAPFWSEQDAEIWLLSFTTNAQA